MSNTDSFIEEVSEAVRRDRLYALMRRYSGLAVALVALIVGGAAYNEWRKAETLARAQPLVIPCWRRWRATRGRTGSRPLPG